MIALGWSLLLMVTGGISWETSTFRISSRDPFRALVIAGLCGIGFWRLAPARVAAYTIRVGRALAGRMHVVALGLSAVIAAAGIIGGTHAASGADSYGYVSQADLWLAGHLKVDQRWLGLPVPFDDWALSPLGYKPGLEPGTIVPSYSPGLPLLMAGAKLVAGNEGAYIVVPLLGGLTVWLTFGPVDRCSATASASARACSSPSAQPFYSS